MIDLYVNERRSVPRLQLHLGDIAYKFVVLYLFYYICLFQFLKHDHLFSFSQLIFYFHENMFFEKLRSFNINNNLFLLSKIKTNYIIEPFIENSNFENRKLIVKV
jgi:hypothetical protein